MQSKLLNWLITILTFSNMAIEIRELHIKINVDDRPQSQETATIKEDERDNIIEACVEQVMEILSKKGER